MDLRKASFEMFYSLFWSIYRRLNFMCRRFGILCSIFIDPIQME